jgi:uncharacterized protein YjfI (DUF2170 family)
MRLRHQHLLALTTCFLLPVLSAQSIPRNAEPLKGTNDTNAFARFEPETGSKAREAAGVLSTDRIIPLFRNGPSGYLNIQSSFVVFNTLERAIEISAEYFDSEGNRVTLPMADLATGGFEGEYTGMVGPIGARSAAAAVTYPHWNRMDVAWVRIRSIPSGAVEVVSSTSATLPGVMHASGDVPVYRNTVRSHTMLVDSESWPRLSVLNVSSLTNRVTLKARNLSGRELCRSTAIVRSGEINLYNLRSDWSCFGGLSGSVILDIEGEYRGVMPLAFSPGGESYYDYRSVTRE